MPHDDDAISPSWPRSALIVGAGDLGLGVAEHLVAAGVETATLNRSGRSVSGAAAITGDLAVASSLLEVNAARPEGWEQVIFTTAPPGRDEEAYRTAYVEGPTHLLDALAVAPQRAVLISTTGVIGIDDGGWVDETAAAVPSRATAAVVLEGERRLADRVPTAIIRPAGIYGPNRRGLRDRVARGEAHLSPPGTVQWTNRIHRDDLVQAIVTVIGHPDPPPLVLAVDDEPCPRNDIVQHLADLLDVRLTQGDGEPLVTGKRCRNTLLRSLGWVPEYPSYREGYEEILS